MKTVSTSNAPAAVGPYSQAVLSGNLLFLSGQLGIDPQTGQLEDGIEKQAARAIINIGEILKAEGLSYENVVKTTVFLSDMNDFGILNEIYAKYFIGKPARSCVAAASLPKGALVEIEAIAEKF